MDKKLFFEEEEYIIDHCFCNWFFYNNEKFISIHFIELNNNFKFMNWDKLRYDDDDEHPYYFRLFASSTIDQIQTNW